MKTGTRRRYRPNDFRPRPAVSRQARRWVAGGSFEATTHDVRDILRVAAGRNPTPSAVILGGRTLRSTPASGARAGYGGHERTNGSKVDMAVHTLGHRPARTATPATAQDRDPVFALGAAVRDATGQSVTLADVDRGDTGDPPAAAHGVAVEVVKAAAPKTGFVLLPGRWADERSFGWAARFRRLGRDDGRLAATRAGWHGVAFVGLMPHRLTLLTCAGS